MALKIMPSYNTEKHAIYMTATSDSESSQISNGKSLMSSLQMQNTFFLVKNTETLFPTLEYTKDSIPVGNSITMCLNLNFAPAESYYLTKKEETSSS